MKEGELLYVAHPHVLGLGYWHDNRKLRELPDER